jgi:hypothetical protein
MAWRARYPRGAVDNKPFETRDKIYQGKKEAGIKWKLKKSYWKLNFEFGSFPGSFPGGAPDEKISQEK